MHHITKCWNALTNVTDKYPGIKELTFDDSMLATTFTGPNHGKRSAHALLAPLSVIYSSLLRGLPLETGRKNRLEPRNGQEKNKARCYFSHVPSAQSETREGISLGILRTMSLMMLHNRPISQLPQCTRSISHNVPFRTEMCTFLFWMVRCWIWNRCIQRQDLGIMWFQIPSGEISFSQNILLQQSGDGIRALFQYSIRHLIVRSREISNPRDLS